jgi:hypothetical protein
MQLFGIEAGREVGIIKNQIREAILEGEIPNDPRGCFKLHNCQRFRNWLKSCGQHKIELKDYFCSQNSQKQWHYTGSG